MEWPRFGGRSWSRASGRWVVPLVVDGRQIADGGVPPAGTVPYLDDLEGGRSRFGLRPVPVEELTLEGGEEALAERVIIAVADRSQGRPRAGLSAPAPKAVEVWCDP
jgi:hypothetical protein